MQFKVDRAVKRGPVPVTGPRGPLVPLTGPPFTLQGPLIVQFLNFNCIGRLVAYRNMGLGQT